MRCLKAKITPSPTHVIWYNVNIKCKIRLGGLGRPRALFDAPARPLSSSGLPPTNRFREATSGARVYSQNLLRVIKRTGARLHRNTAMRASSCGPLDATRRIVWIFALKSNTTVNPTAAHGRSRTLAMLRLLLTTLALARPQLSAAASAESSEAGGGDGDRGPSYAFRPVGHETYPGPVGFPAAQWPHYGNGGYTATAAGEVNRRRPAPNVVRDFPTVARISRMRAEEPLEPVSDSTKLRTSPRTIGHSYNQPRSRTRSVRPKYAYTAMSPKYQIVFECTTAF